MLLGPCCMDRDTELRSMASSHLVAHNDGRKAMVSNMHVAEIALGFDGLPLPRLRALHDRPRKEIQTLLHGPALEVATSKRSEGEGLRGSWSHKAQRGGGRTQNC